MDPAQANSGSAKRVYRVSADENTQVSWAPRLRGGGESRVERTQSQPALQIA